MVTVVAKSPVTLLLPGLYFNTGIRIIHVGRCKTITILGSLNIFNWLRLCYFVREQCTFLIELLLCWVRISQKIYPLSYVPVNSKTAPPLCASFDGQMPHPLELHRGLDPPPCHAMHHEIDEYKQNRLPLETRFAKFSATTNFLFNLSSLHTLNKGIFHDITI